MAPRLKALWDTDAAAFGGWCAIPSSVPAEFLAAEGFDYIGIDCQHGFAGPETLISMLQAVSHYDVPAVVRVPTGSGWWIERALDLGAEAVIVPMVNTADEAAAAVAHCRYPPLGDRSYGPIRAELVMSPAPRSANDTVVCMVMVETAAAVEAIDEICATPGLDGVYIGPVDLAISLGQPPRLAPVPGPHADAMERVRAAAVAHGIIAGVHSASGDQAREYAEQGYRMITVSSDLALMRSYARTQLRNARGIDQI